MRDREREGVKTVREEETREAEMGEGEKIEGDGEKGQRL